jgi:peptidoglycan-N-acetylglucosamine deacetylase
MTKPIASLSLDLDNKWCYLRTHGVAGWDKYPSYLDTAVPRVLELCAERNLRITCFVVGRDATLDENADALMSLAVAGHEIANHTFDHPPWLHSLPRARVESEIVAAEEAIERATGERPIGFRGPAYGLSNDVLAILVQRGYRYDATTLPTYIGPLARWYFRRTASSAAIHEAERREMFGSFRNGFRSNQPYVWETAAGLLPEIPVTTFPWLKLPIHMTYLWYLCSFSPRLAHTYFSLALAACRAAHIGPSLLVHPLDFLDAEDEPDLRFFPGMNIPRAKKWQFVSEVISSVQRYYDVQPLAVHAASMSQALDRSDLAMPSGAAADELVAR